jgi:hypothetical protein
MKSSKSAKLGYVRLDAQSSMRSGIITVTSHEFKARLCWYYRVWEVKDCESSLVTSGMTFIPNFIKGITYVIIKLVLTDI